MIFFCDTGSGFLFEIFYVLLISVRFIMVPISGGIFIKMIRLISSFN